VEEDFPISDEILSFLFIVSKKILALILELIYLNYFILLH